MKILVDMNLSPSWIGFLASKGFEATHWSDLGPPGAEDATLMSWARANQFVVFTHDMDFSALIALAGSNGPSILQIRTQNVLPEDIGDRVVAVLNEHAESFIQGSIVTVVEHASRVRVLPIMRQTK